MAVDLLGPFELRVDGELVVVSRLQVRRLAALLAVNGGVEVATDTVIENLWPGDLPADPRATLRVISSRLRSALGEAEGALTNSGTGLALDADVDLERFARGVTAGLEGAAETLEAALALWRGDPPPDLAGAPLIDAALAKATALRWAAIGASGEAMLGRDDLDRAVALLAPLVAAEPERERLTVTLALAHARRGRKAEALEVLAATRRALLDQLGLDPTDAFVAAEASILRNAIDLAGADRLRRRSDAGAFVGRHGELATLVAPGPGTTLVLGEAGIGKSALLAEVARRLETTGRRLVTIAADQAPDAPMALAADLIRAVVDPAVAVLDRPTRAALAILVPEVDWRPGDALASLDRPSLVGLVARAVEEQAPPEQVALALDDLQWADSGSLLVVGRLVAAGRCRLVLASRPGAPAVEQLSEQAENPLPTIALGPLGEPEVRELLDQTVPRAATEAASIHARTGGHPLFVTLLASMRAEGVTDVLPSSVLVAVQERLGVLSAPTRETLSVAALLGQSFSVPLLARLRPDAAQATVEGRNAGILDDSADPQQARFAHALLAEGAAALLPAGRRIAWHDEIASVLDAAGQPAAAWVDHAEAAAQLDRLRAVRGHVDAANEYAAAFVWDAVRRHADAVVVGSVTASGGGVPSRQVVEAAVLQGRALRGLGEAESESVLLAAAEDAMGIGADDLLAEAVIELCSHGQTSAVGWVHDKTLALLREVLQHPLDARARARLGAAANTLLSSSVHQDEARELFHESLLLARELGDASLEATVLMHAHTGLGHPDDLGEREAAARRLADLADTDPDLGWEAAFLHFGVALIHADRPRLDESLAEMRRLAPLVVRRPRTVGMLFSEAAYALVLDDPTLAERRSEELLGLAGEAYSASWVTSVYGALIVSIRGAQGRLGELLAFADQLVAGAPDYISWRVVALACAAADGQADRVRSEVPALATNDFHDLIPDVTWSTAATLLGHPIEMAGDTHAAAALYDRLIAHTGRMSWNGMSSQGPIDATLARLAAVLGDAERHQLHLRRSAEVLDRIGHGRVTLPTS